jgi:thiamine biosynthesis protein ThiI
MVRTAGALAKRDGAQALVTGDSLGQVASQTLHNMAVVDEAAALPVLRPLLGWDKAEIIREAEEIDTLEVSNLPAEDCCTLFASPLAETRAHAGRLARIESRLELDELVDELGRDRPAAADVGVVRGDVLETVGRAVGHHDDGGTAHARDAHRSCVSR